MFYRGFSVGPIGISYYPAFPRYDEPVQVTVRLSNIYPEARVFVSGIYLDGCMVAEWVVEVDGGSVREYRILTPGNLGVGGSLKIYVEAFDPRFSERYSASVMIPPFPPEAFSSFVSFAGFSSTLIGYMATLSYYTNTMMPVDGVDVGLTLSLTLIGLLVFLELTDPVYGRICERIDYLRRNFVKEAIVLLAVFLAMVATKIIFILYGV
ncbi:MAG: hypothetical protein N3E44_05295 [Candidatus Bathyarchaeota archaeon]|nr:hypothetical protein [Candidatus Bathyarchaeota archaeon]